MVGGKICLSFIDHRSHEPKTISKLLYNIEYVEQLISSVLDDEGIKPVCKSLFGLKLIKEDIWLAPNEHIAGLLNWSRKRASNGEPRLEIRMRFRPSCLTRVSMLDPIAFEVIFGQINHDFMKTRFNDEKRDFVLLDDSVLGLIALNLVRYTVEHGLSVEEVLKQVKAKDFIPKRGAKWQVPLIFPLAKQINLIDSMKKAFEECENDLQKIKQRFIELFLLNVATDYNAEIYDVYQLIPAGDNMIKSGLAQLRVRYNQSRDDATCLIEIRSKAKHKSNKTGKRNDYSEKWVEICDIETISHATINENQVQIARVSGEPKKFQFLTSKHAKSFLTCIDGYHRLMKKWNYNLCREISSPELKYLAELGCHGPIGSETTKTKLFECKRSDCYLVRKCMDHSNKFLIDTFVCDRVLLTIDVDWLPERKVFTQTGHTTSLPGLKVNVKTYQENYSTLKTLINDTEIVILNDLRNNLPRIKRNQQLKYMIYPKEDDVYPALMLSTSIKKFKEQEKNSGPQITESNRQRPVVIPGSSLSFMRKLYPVANNGLSAELGTLDDSQQVVVKSHTELSLRGHMSEFTFHNCPNGHGSIGVAQSLRPSQLRIADWLFVKSEFIADTVGFIMPDNLVQEFFPAGRLDTFLKEKKDDINKLTKLSASFQLAQALLFLDDRRIIHGKIRCHNVMLKQTHPIQVKLTDPLGAIDVSRDQAFIPSEYFSANIQLCVEKYYSGIDVWATGTTIWQIFNHGLDPPAGRYANTLTRLECPDNVWHLIERCWLVEPNFRITPRILHRDLFELIAWEEQSHNYLYINSTDLHVKTDHHDTPLTTNSSNSDLSTLDNVGSSILSSPNSTCSDNSRADLLKPRISLYHEQETQPDAWQRLNSIPGRPAVIQPANNSLGKRAYYWTTLMGLNRMKSPRSGSQDDGSSSPARRLSDLDDIFDFDEATIGGYSTPSGSEMTRSTEIMDSQSISDALDRCIWLVDSSKIKLGAEIGRGSSGIVIKGVMSRTDGIEEVVAVKCIDRERTNLNSIEDLKREFDILKNLDHKNIVKTLGYVKGSGSSQMMLIFEYMPLGSLLSCVRNLASRGDIFKLPLKKYALDIAKGMEYLESKKIVHRDLALRNILLNNSHEVKICDFGLAQSLGTNNHYKLETERPLPLKWYAPETLTSWVFTHKSDVWSYGVVLWELYSGGDSPHYSGTYADLSETLKHVRLPMPLDCPRHMYDLMLACWAYDPDARKSFEEIRQLLE
jgi:serine/threonine protein kinase